MTEPFEHAISLMYLIWKWSMLQKYSKLVGNGNMKDSYMILSKHMHLKQDGKQPSTAVILNTHVIKIEA